MTSESCPSPDVSDRAWRSGRAQAFFWAIVALSAGLDLLSKWWAFKFIRADEIMTAIPGVLRFNIIRNPGAVFGLGAGRRWLFIGASLVAVGFILQLFAQSRRRQWGFHLLLALVLGGAIGNLYDRAFHGMVRDFIFVHIGPLEIWPWVFNVADVALVVGVGGLLIGWLMGKFDITGSALPVARPVGPSAKPGESCSCGHHHTNENAG